MDRQLIRMLAARQRLVETIASIKGSKDSVCDPVRETKVLENVRLMATISGLSPAIALPLWRDMITHFTRHQIHWLARSDPDQSHPVSDPVESADTPVLPYRP